MANQKIFSGKAVSALLKNVLSGEIPGAYSFGEFSFSENDFFENTEIIEPDDIKLVLPDGENFSEFENAKMLFEAYSGLTGLQATDRRFWTYLTHCKFQDYVRKRSPLPAELSKKREHILTHWFIKSINATDLFRNDISSLWWMVKMTVDQDEENPYILTEELFSMRDYTRTLVTSSLGRIPEFTKAVLRYVIENPELFSFGKEAKVRFIMRKLNFTAAYRVFSSLETAEIMKIIESFRDEIHSEKRVEGVEGARIE